MNSLSSRTISENDGEVWVVVVFGIRVSSVGERGGAFGILSYMVLGAKVGGSSHSKAEERLHNVLL